MPRDPKRWLKRVPNAISICRLALAAAFPFLPDDWRLPAVIIGGLSDYIDGLIARRAGARSISGQVLDPIADKAFVLSVLLTLSFAGTIEWWQALIVLTRDIVVVLCAAVLLLTRSDVSAGWVAPVLLGKVATMMIYFWLVLELGGWSADASLALFLAAAAFSIAAAIAYVYRSFQLSAGDREQVEA